MAAKQTIVKTTTRRSAVKIPKSSTNRRGSNKCPVCGKFMSTKKG